MRTMLQLRLFHLKIVSDQKRTTLRSEGQVRFKTCYASKNLDLDLNNEIVIESEEDKIESVTSIPSLFK